MVVIVIVAALVAVTIVMVTRARRQANSTKSIANLRQFGTAMLSFSTENNNRMPGVVHNELPDLPQPVSWDGCLFPYLGLENEEAGKLPKQHENLFVHGNDKRTNPDTYCRRTYAMFQAPVSQTDDELESWAEDEFTPVSKAEDPARVGLLTERPWGGGYAGLGAFAEITTPSQMTKNRDSGEDLNASGKFNVLFADGHIESLHPEATVGTGSLGDPKGIWTFSRED
jgi:prepilin-type processing-associated H-X9-DG protein